MNMFMAVVISFDFQAGKIDAVAVKDFNGKRAAGRAGGINIFDLEFMSTGRAFGGGRFGFEFQFSPVHDGAGSELAEIELDGF
jgi:hypothetical protein